MSKVDMSKANMSQKKFPPVHRPKVFTTINCMDLPLHHRKILKMAVPKTEAMQPESVYKHETRPVETTGKPQRYVSKFRAKIIEESKANKMSMRTMGPATVEVSHDMSLRKPINTPKKVPHNCPEKKPPVPLRTERPPVDMRPERDFLKTIGSLKTVKPEPAFMDTKGHREILQKSGFVPVYTKKKDYGRIPKYLLQRYEENLLNAENEFTALKEMIDKHSRKLMSDEERQSILKGLKNNWNQLNSDYHLLPLIVETHSTRARKKRLEEELKQLESTIALFEDYSNPIYLPHNDD